jgi:hypothetical protein
MKTLLTGIITGVVLCAISAAQDATPAPVNPARQNPAAAQPQPASPPASGSLRIAPGSVIPVQLTKTIDAKKVKSGDAIEARVTQDLKSNSGEIVVPKDTRVTGHVTESQARNKEQKESQVGLAFDHAILKDGADVALPMSIQAVISQSALQDDTANSSPSSGEPPPPPASSSAGMPASGRTPGMGAGTPPATSPAASGDYPSTSQEPKAHQPITGSTQGVVGIPNLKLSATADAAQGSVLTSDKNNVKLEDGTLMLLRVNR